MFVFLFAGAAAARGQAGKCDAGSCAEYHREVHLPPQVQEGELASRPTYVVRELGEWGV